jgi:hypothetical protein
LQPRRGRHAELGVCFRGGASPARRRSRKSLARLSATRSRTAPLRSRACRILSSPSRSVWVGRRSSMLRRSPSPSGCR